MPSLLLTSPETTLYGHDQPRISGSSRRLDKAGRASTPTSLRLDESEANLYHVHRSANIPQDAYIRHARRMPANEDSTHGHTTKDYAALRAHNALQPIARLSADVLEHLFLLGIALSSSSSLSSHSARPAHAHPYSYPYSTHYRDSPTRTALTYAQLTAPLRRVALGSPRLWARVLDFECHSPRWTDELLRRSAGASLDVVFQWSRALGRPQRDSWSMDPRALEHEEAEAKRMRLDGVLHAKALACSRSMGVAVPAPLFDNVLLPRLADRSAARRLARLESLRLVRSRARLEAGASNTGHVGPGMEEIAQEGKDEPAPYVPLAVLAAAPRLRELALAETWLPLHELRAVHSSLSSSSSFTSAPLPPHHASSPPPLLSPSLHSVTLPTVTQLPTHLAAQHTLAGLRRLHIADLPLHLAPTSREWLAQLRLMPGLEALLLEGAVLRAADLPVRAAERARVRLQLGQSMNGEWKEEGCVFAPDEDENEEEASGEKGRGEGLPRLRVLTLDAALVDVGELVAALPLPLPSLPSSPGAPSAEPCVWTLHCADADAGDLGSLSRTIGVLERAAAAEGNVALAIKAPDSDVALSLRAGARATIHVHLQPTPIVHPNTDATAHPHPDDALLAASLGMLARDVLPHATRLQLDVPPLSASGARALRDALGRAARVRTLGLGTAQGAAGAGADGARAVLKTIGGARRASVSSDASVSTPTCPAVQPGIPPDTGSASPLPALTHLALPGDAVEGAGWATLLRCVRARRAGRAPLARVALVEREAVVWGELGADRVRELEGLGVGVTVQRARVGADADAWGVGVGVGEVG